MSRFLLVMLVLVGLTPAHAQGPAKTKILYELFTSQGCDSCPPADRLLGQIKRRKDVVALAFHVDYWDYLGWEDSFAFPGATARQNEYARTLDQRTIYTPQVILKGIAAEVGHDRANIEAHLNKMRDSAPVVEVDKREIGKRLEFIIDPLGNKFGRSEVWVALYEPSARVTIKAGENAGRTLQYHNIVRRVHKLGNWDGKSVSFFIAEAPEHYKIALIVQRPGFGEVVIAEYLR